MATATAPIESEIETGESDRSGKCYYHEIADGHPTGKPHMGAESDEIIVDLLALIKTHPSGKLGKCYSGHCGYQIFADNPHRIRYPDISFIRKGRLPGDTSPRGYVEVVPDLVVEVVSPNDKAENVEQRLADYLRAGVPLAWMIYPLTKQVYVFHQGPAALRPGEGNVLDGEDVLPGFACPLKDLFAGI